MTRVKRQVAQVYRVLNVVPAPAGVVRILRTSRGAAYGPYLGGPGAVGGPIGGPGGLGGKPVGPLLPPPPPVSAN